MPTSEGRNDWFARLLLPWYDDYGRDLPWRQTHDPYRVWVSEVILQQTRVAQGWDYFLRFMQAFPTVEALAAASQDEVMRQWQGLGYYSRARNLHAAAQQIVARGSFPDTYDEVIRLKGVGEYTAAAILSFAFGQPCAVVDGNVYRVLSRVFRIDEPIDTTAGHKTFAALARQLISHSRPADHNQALMDLGATVCTPHAPRCMGCPLAAKCTAHAGGCEADYPKKQGRVKTHDRYLTYFYIERQGKVLLHLRGEGDIWQGLYELPVIETPAPLSQEAVCARLRPLGEPLLHAVCHGLKHQLTHQTLHADCYLLQGLPGASLHTLFDAPAETFRWVGRESLSDYPVPRLVERLLEQGICK